MGKLRGIILRIAAVVFSVLLFCGFDTEAASSLNKTVVKSINATSTTSIKVKVTKQKGVAGYQLRYSTKSTMKSAKITGKFKGTAKTISNLKAGTKYFIQVRTYNKVGKKYKYSSWSAKKSVVTKVSPTLINSISAESTTSVKTVIQKKNSVSGNQLRYSTKSNMGSSRLTGTFSGSVKTISGLKAGTTYYVQVRTYKKIGNKKYYSAWSAVKSITTKTDGDSNSSFGSCNISGSSNTEMEVMQSEYSYEINLLPNKCGYYNNQNVAIYVRTDDPDWIYATALGEKYSFAGTNYDDIFETGNMEFNGSRRVSSGYVIYLCFETSGNKTLNFRRCNSQTGKIEEISGLEFSFTLKDYEKSRSEWLSKTMNEVTDASMSDNEKLTELMNFIRNHFLYDYMYRDSGKVSNLYYYSGPWWVRDYNDCWDATDAMCFFADMLGLESESTDASDMPGAGAWHTVATVYIDGVAHTYDATPLKQGYIDNYDILIN